MLVEQEIKMVKFFKNGNVVRQRDPIKSISFVLRNRPLFKLVGKICNENLNLLHMDIEVKGALSGLTQFLATEIALKMIKVLFISCQKLFLFPIYLSFFLDFLVMYQNGLIRKTRLISNFMTSQPD